MEGRVDGFVSVRRGAHISCSSDRQPPGGPPLPPPAHVEPGLLGTPAHVEPGLLGTPAHVEPGLPGEDLGGVLAGAGGLCEVVQGNEALSRAGREKQPSPWITLVLFSDWGRQRLDCRYPREQRGRQAR